jgi:branched-chain amino acid transport system ATP-binding protein
MTAVTSTPTPSTAAGSATAASSDAMLELRNVHTFYGRVRALQGMSIVVNRGEVVTLIGSNGAGKTTTLKTVSGLIHPRQGKVFFEGKDITQSAAHELVKVGIAHAPEGRRIFGRLSVLENLQMGGFTRPASERSEELERALSLFPRLRERLHQRGGSLSGGEQQMLAIGRALMSKPRLLLLDEPSLGLSPLLVQQIFQLIRQINEQGTTILLVEQNAQQALAVATRGYVLQTGKVILSDTGPALAQNADVRRAYLGEI